MPEYMRAMEERHVFARRIEASLPEYRIMWDIDQKYLHDDAFNWVERAEWAIDLLNRAAPYWVAPDLCVMLDAAYSSLPYDFALHPHHVLTPTGFVYLSHAQRPFEPGEFWDWDFDSDGRLGLDPEYSVDEWIDDDEERRERGSRETRGSVLNGSTRAIAWERTETGVRCFDLPFPLPAHIVNDHDMWPSHALGSIDEWQFGTQIGDATWANGGDLKVRLLLGAFLLLAGERLTATSHERPDRAARKRAERAGVDIPDIRVVTLRAVDRKRPDDEDESGFVWDHRWLVRGHWHRYWKGPEGAKTLEPKWVAPYVKGPNGAPLRVPAGELFAVTR